MSRPSRSFGLLELLVVTTILTIAAGLLVTRLDGFSATARLQSTAAQYSAVLKLARTDALSGGQPRLLTVANQEGMVTVQRPVRRAGRWEWDKGRAFQLGSAVIDQVLHEDEDAAVDRSVRITAEGRVTNHAVVLRASDRWAVYMQNSDESRFLLLPRKPLATSYRVLMTELESLDEESESPDTD